MTELEFSLGVSLHEETGELAAEVFNRILQSSSSLFVSGLSAKLIRRLEWLSWLVWLVWIWFSS